MTTKNKSKKKQDSKNSKKQETKPEENNYKKLLSSVFILVLIVAGSFAALYIFFPPVKTVAEKIENKKTIVVNKKDLPQKTKEKASPKNNESANKNPLYEVYDKNIHTEKIEDEKKEYKGKPKICIIIDDIGYDKSKALSFSKLGVPITLSVLPFTPYGKEIVNTINNTNTEFMIHLPMQPKEYPKINPGKGVLLEEMSPDQITATLKKDLDFLPSIKGVNNHMGSKLTENSEIMNQVFIILKKRDLFFIDSLTSAQSRCDESARLFQIQFAKRDIFLDNIQDVKAISQQFLKLHEVALKKGSAVGIGHPYSETIMALKKSIKRFDNKVDFVKASSIVKNSQ